VVRGTAKPDLAIAAGEPADSTGRRGDLEANGIVGHGSVPVGRNDVVDAGRRRRFGQGDEGQFGRVEVVAVDVPEGALRRAGAVAQVVRLLVVGRFGPHHD